MATTWNKHAGLPVFPPHDAPDQPSVLAQVLTAHPSRAAHAWPDGFFGGIAHRLDTSTSGALLLADDPEELVTIRAAFASGRLRKRYLFRAARDVPWDTHTVDLRLAHDKRHKRRMVAQRGPSTPHRGQWYEAHTELRRIRGSLWEAVITTGVMHQIRVHCAFVGLPLVGDSLYGGGPTPHEAPPGATFLLHHAGMVGAGVRTDAVPAPPWAWERP